MSGTGRIPMLQSSGNGNMLHKKQVPLSHSTVHLSEIMDNICNSMDDYVRARDKETGELIIMPIVINGKMNSKMSEVDVIQDSDMNKSLKYYCEEMVSEYEDLIIDLVQMKIDNLKYKICTREASYCKEEEGEIHDEL